MEVSVIYQGPISSPGVVQVQSIISELSIRHPSKFTVLISSNGGDLESGLAFYNLLRSVPYPVRTVNIGVCGSIAATIFMAGRERVAYPATTFTLHAPRFFTGPKTGQLSPRAESIWASFAEIAQWDEQTITVLFGSEEVTIDAADAHRRKVATSIERLILSPHPVLSIDPRGTTPPNLTLLGAASA